MNKTAVRRTIEALRKDREHFRMNTWEHPVDLIGYGDAFCNSPGCIGAFAVYANGKREALKTKDGTLWETAREVLGLSFGEAVNLFAPRYCWTGFRSSSLPGEPGFVSADRALGTLELFLETGNIDWRGAQEQKNPGR